MGVSSEPCDLPRGGGLGVVYVGADRWPYVAAACQLIREMGCAAPVQVWFRPGDPVNPERADRLDVDLMDLSAYGGLGARTADPWVALARTHLDRVVLLDSHTYPLRAPCKLGNEISSMIAGYWTDEAGAPEAAPMLYNRERMILSALGFCTETVRSGTSMGKSTAITRDDLRGYRIVRRPTFARAGTDAAFTFDADPMTRRMKELLIAAGVLACAGTTSTSAARA